MNEDVMLRADEKKINWYPGHMARAKRALADQLSRVDVVVELCDARIPRASRNPDLADMIKNKRHLLVLGKADLADERETRAWLGYFRAQGIDCMSFDSIRGKAKDIIARIEKASADAVARMAAKGVKKTVRVMIVGVPNVGKSTFTNRINGASIARTGDRCHNARREVVRLVVLLGFILRDRLLLASGCIRLRCFRRSVPGLRGRFRLLVIMLLLLVFSVGSRRAIRHTVRGKTKHAKGVKHFLVLLSKFLVCKKRALAGALSNF